MTYANNGRHTTILEQACRVVFPYPVRGRTIPPLVIDVGGSARVLAGPNDPTVFGDQLLIIPSAPTRKVSVIQRA
jgi:hypothetical protein